MQLPHELGLSSVVVQQRLALDGPNELPERNRASAWGLLRDVLHEPMLLLLVLAAVLYAVLGDPREALVLGCSVFVVVAITVFQSMRSEKALAALRSLSSPRAAVVRDGALVHVPSRELVCGDVVVLGEGDRVPADANVLDGHGLQVDESLLSGESAPVAKHAGPDQTPAPGDFTAPTRVYSGTLVTAGNAVVRVVATGTRTALGRIGLALRDVPLERTPLQREFDAAVRVFAVFGLGLCAVVVVLYGTLRGDWFHAALAGIALAIANIPEEFPVVLTVFLALGALRMARRRVIVRRAPAIETLGSVTTLCVDKTGTLTENQMTVAALVAGAANWNAGAGPIPATFEALLDCAARASELRPFDPMEKAILAACGHERRTGEVVHEYALSAAVPAHTHVWRIPGRTAQLAACKGAPETIASLCGLDAGQRAALEERVARLAARGLRVIAVAAADWSSPGPWPAAQTGYAFRLLGLIGFADPLRAGVPAAIAAASAAGVRTIMLTGDHAETARAIAQQAGMPDAQPAHGPALAALDDAALSAALQRHCVFARVAPALKLRIVEQLKARGDVVAMTGDGVNDAPALKAAHVGIAMGRRGTDVAREAAAIVLLDDDFPSIVRAIRLGREIYDNLARALRFILSVHVPVGLLTLLPLLVGGPVVLWPIHIVFLELVIDPTCALAFEREPPAKDLMLRPPRRPDARLFTREMLLRSLGDGVAVAVAATLIYLCAWKAELPTGHVAALTFSSIVAGNLGLIAVHRNAHGLRGALRLGNPAYWAILALTLSALTASLYLEAVQPVFRFVAPPFALLLGALTLPVLLLAALHLPLRAAPSAAAQQVRG